MLKSARIAVFVSGGGTNLQALLDAQRDGKIPHGEIALVISSQACAYALERAEKANVPAHTVPSSLIQHDFEAAIELLLEQYKIDVIVLAGFLSILSENFTKKWPRRIINIHKRSRFRLWKPQIRVSGPGPAFFILLMILPSHPRLRPRL